MTDGTAASTMTRDVITRERLCADLRALGVGSGETLLVHASLRLIGWVDGGAESVVAALREVLGPDGTLVAGAGTPENSVTSRTFKRETRGYTAAQLAGYRGRMPAFDRETTPTSVGAIAEALRTAPGAVRSAHPQSSFAAVGYHAQALMAGHRIACHLGDQSPLAKLYDQDASILLLGVDYRSCTAMHLAEYWYRPRPPMRTYACVVRSSGARRWITYRDVVLDDADFPLIGEEMEKWLAVRSGDVGYASSRLLRLREAVDFTVRWMANNRR